MKSTAFLIGIFGLFLLTSCSKNNFCEPDSTQAPPSEIAQVEAYLNSNGITATKDGRGFYYIIKNEGTGKFATICSNVTVNYVGRLTNGTQAPPSEIAQVEAYLNSNGITATKDGRGFYYIIKSEGTGKFATICSNVTVNYVGRLTNGTQFDSNNNISFAIRGLIKGWQQGIPLLKPGGSITLFISPSLGYGAQATPSIPANSILIFDIDLLAIN